MVRWKVLVDQLEEFLGDICFHVLAVWRVKPCDFTFPTPAPVAVNKGCVVSAFLRASSYGGLASLNTDSLEEMPCSHFSTVS